MTTAFWKRQAASRKLRKTKPHIGCFAQSIRRQNRPMDLVIQNGVLRLAVNSFGAQMMALTSASGVSYLWSGDERYWKDRAINPFPYVARLYKGCYRLGERVYSLPIHGLAMYNEFIVERRDQAFVTFLLESSEQTMEAYPFRFNSGSATDWTGILWP